MREIWGKDRKPFPSFIPIILVIILVVVALVSLYVLFFRQTTEPSKPRMDVRVCQLGTNWTVAIVSVPQGQQTTDTYLTIYAPDGSVAPTCNRVALSDLNFTFNRATYAGTGSYMQPGDNILISYTTYDLGYSFELSDDRGVLVTEELAY